MFSEGLFCDSHSSGHCNAASRSSITASCCCCYRRSSLSCRSSSAMIRKVSDSKESSVAALLNLSLLAAVVVSSAIPCFTFRIFPMNRTSPQNVAFVHSELARSRAAHENAERNMEHSLQERTRNSLTQIERIQRRNGSE